MVAAFRLMGLPAGDLESFLGRYRFGRAALRATGMLDQDGRWTGRHGAASDEAFDSSRPPQDDALIDLVREMERRLEENGSNAHLGRTVRGVRGEFVVTEAGLLGAALRQGSEPVREYLEHLEASGWRSDFAALPDAQRRLFLRIEARLRHFEEAPYR